MARSSKGKKYQKVLGKRIQTRTKSGGRKYHKDDCFTTVSKAKRAAEQMRKKGFTARVKKKANGGACVYTAGKRICAYGYKGGKVPRPYGSKKR